MAYSRCSFSRASRAVFHRASSDRATERDGEHQSPALSLAVRHTAVRVVDHPPFFSYELGFEQTPELCIAGIPCSYPSKNPQRGTDATQQDQAACQHRHGRNHHTSMPCITAAAGPVQSALNGMHTISSEEYRTRSILSQTPTLRNPALPARESAPARAVVPTQLTPH
jgi:hypothetical protein